MSESPPGRLTESTKTAADEILAESREIAALGYALNRGETIDGVMAVAAPIYRGGGEQATLLAGLSVAGPADRLSRRLDQIRPAVLQTAEQIGLALKPR